MRASIFNSRHMAAIKPRWFGFLNWYWTGNMSMFLNIWSILWQQISGKYQSGWWKAGIRLEPTSKIIGKRWFTPRHWISTCRLDQASLKQPVKYWWSSECVVQKCAGRKRELLCYLPSERWSVHPGTGSVFGRKWINTAFLLLIISKADINQAENPLMPLARIHFEGFEHGRLICWWGRVDVWLYDSVRLAVAHHKEGLRSCSGATSSNSDTMRGGW